MITTNLAKNALAIAQQLKETGVTLGSADNSVLSKLVDTSVPYGFKKNGDSAVTVYQGNKIEQVNGSDSVSCSLDEMADCISYATGNSYETSPHTLAITAMADDLAPLVSSHIYAARSVVLPLVKKFEEDAERYLSLAKTKDPSSDFNLNVLRIPALLGDESFLAMGLDEIVNLNEVRSETRRLYVKIESMEQAVAEICNLGNDRLNGLVSEWLEFAPENIIARVLKANLDDSADYHPDDLHFNQYQLRTGNQGLAMHISLAMWLIASWLKSNVKETRENASLSEYNESMQTLIDEAGVTLKFALMNLKNQVEGNVMVTSMMPSKKEISVHDSLYRKYLEEGGKSEALLGMLVSGKSFFDKGVILENQAALIENWNTYLSFRATKDLTDIRAGFQSWVRSYMAIQINEQTDLEVEYSKTCQNLKEQVMKLVDEEICRLDHRLHEDIGHTALHLVAKARFFFTSAYSILGEMLQVARVNKGIDPREAATASVIAYLVEYLFSQVKITSLLK